MSESNRRILLRTRPSGMPSTDDFELVTEDVPEPGPKEVLVRSLWLSLDPYMRGRMRDAKSYAPPVQLGEVMTGGVVGRVERSNLDRLPEGTIVEGGLGWQDYAVSDGRGLRVVDPDVAPISTAVGVLGMPGMTAWSGLFEVGRPRPGETVVVSAAAGAVGQVVGQLARISGCRAVGIAGSDEKVTFCTDELGFDACINYRTQDVRTALAETCPDGVDVYFDNVGGEVSEAVFAHLAVGARIPVCGQISQYNLEQPELSDRSLAWLIPVRARMEGFLVYDFVAVHEEARRRMARWIADGTLRYREDVAEGLEQAPEAFLGLFTGANLGKLLVKVADQ